jgi:alanine racemase
MPLLKVLVDRKRVPTVKFNGKSALTLGRISMQLTSVDVTELPEVIVGSIAEIPMLRLAASEGIPRVVVD